MKDYQVLYERQYRHEVYAPYTSPDVHHETADLCEFIRRYGLADSKILEIGCGRGAFQDLVRDYVGTDISTSAGRFLHKSFAAASATELPFADDQFDVVWSVQVLEHVHEPESALAEMRRVTRHEGYIYLSPAWYCRPWAAQGYSVRRYKDLDIKGKLVKLSIPLRNGVPFRSMLIGPRRLRRHLTWLLQPEATRFLYRSLKPNYTRYWTSDSDACNSMDPHEAILWFASRGDVCLSHPGHLAAVTVRTGAVEFQVRKHR
jgi:ubiquinone/menaquinone biosynthesis C-methylase UbiE